MSNVLMLLQENGTMLLTGTTILLGLGCLFMLLHRAPIHRQRLGELTILGALAWMVLALAPMPRPLDLLQFSGIRSERRATEELTIDEMDWLGEAVEGDSIESLAHFSSSKVNATRNSAKSGSDPNALRIENRPSAGESHELADKVTVGNSATAIPRTSDVSVTERSWFASPNAWMKAIAIIYLIGGAICLFRLLLGKGLLWRVVRTSSPPEEWLQVAFNALLAPKRPRRVRLLVSTNHSRPMSFGVFRPTVVLPESECRPENVVRLEYILRHELAHVRQRDALGNLLCNLAFPVLYVHPCFWWLRSQMRMSAELIADELAAGGGSRQDYAHELIQFVRAYRGRTFYPAGATGILDSATRFSRRIEMLIRRDTPLKSNSSKKWRGAMFVAFCLLVATLAAGLGKSAQAESDETQAAERRLKLVEQRLKAVERERDELKKKTAALETQLNELAKKFDGLTTEAKSPETKPAAAPTPNVERDGQQKAALEATIKELQSLIKGQKKKPAENVTEQTAPPGADHVPFPNFHIQLKELKQPKELKLVDLVAGPDLGGICDLEISGDEKSIYSSSFIAGAIAQFAFDPATGRLQYVATVKNESLRGVTDFRLFADAKFGVSSSCHAKTAVLFSRNLESGKLESSSVFKSGDGGTIGLNWPVDVAVSPDSKFIYVADAHGTGASREDQERGGEVTILKRTDDGKLEWVDSDLGQDGCFSAARGILCHPNGRFLFVTCKGHGTLVICERDKLTGIINVLQVHEQGKNDVKCLEGAMTSSLSPDGKFLYTAAGRFGNTGGIGVFHLSEGGDAKLIQQFVNGIDGFEDYVGGNKIVISPDGLRAYASATRSGTLACFQRDPNTGLLTHIETLKSEDGMLLQGANGLAFTSGGRWLLVACEDSGAIAVFEVKR